MQHLALSGCNKILQSLPCNSLHLMYLPMQIFERQISMARFPVDYCVSQRSPGRMLRRLAKMAIMYVEDRLETQLVALDLSFTQWIALKVVKDEVVTTAGELARELGITTGATTRLVDTLEEHGLLVRDRGTGDRRVVKLSVTEAGRAIAQDLMPDVVGAWSDIFEDISEEETDAFIATLAKLFAKAERLAYPVEEDVA